MILLDESGDNEVLLLDHQNKVKNRIPHIDKIAPGINNFFFSNGHGSPPFKENLFLLGKPPAFAFKLESRFLTQMSAVTGQATLLDSFKTE
jgi:hypothetical protein